MASVHIGRLMGPIGFSRLVAIKRLHVQFASDPEFVAMFVDEARLAARIRHPNVVSVVDVVAESGELFLVMDYVIGESLARLVRTAAGPVPIPIALAIMTEVLYGLAAAHDAKSEAGEPLAIVHRDVSPQNVIVGRDGVARVLDFGIAKAASRVQTTQDGKLKGKFAYMSPEQLRRQTVDRRTDIFAASIVLWEVLTGTRLFAADDHGAVVTSILEGEVALPSHTNPAVTPSLDEIVMKGLARRPEDRFQTAQEMAAALEKLGGFARPVEIGAWVERLAKDTLADRARLVGETEGESSSVAPVSGTMKLHDPRDPSTAHPETTDVSSTSSPVRRGRGWFLGAVVAALIVVGVGYAFVTVRNAGHASITSAAPPSNAPVVTASALETARAATADAEVAHPPAPTQPARQQPRHVAPQVTKPDCSTPFTIDAAGLKHFKPECVTPH
jgi:serine/threonine protein kinase